MLLFWPVFDRLGVGVCFAGLVLKAVSGPGMATLDSS